jgi:hypothetical protein
MLSPREEMDYYYWKESELDFLSLQQNARDILMQIPEAEGLRDFHSRDTAYALATQGEDDGKFTDC